MYCYFFDISLKISDYFRLYITILSEWLSWQSLLTYLIILHVSVVGCASMVVCDYHGRDGWSGQFSGYLGQHGSSDWPVGLAYTTYWYHKPSCLKPSLAANCFFTKQCNHSLLPISCQVSSHSQILIVSPGTYSQRRLMWSLTVTEDQHVS